MRALAARREWLAIAAVLTAMLSLIAVNGTASGQDEGGAAPSAERGAALYRAGCATCHGPDGRGVDGWPSIADAGEAAADFQLRTGRMPFSGRPGEQAMPKPPAYDEAEIGDLVAFVGTLGEGPPIPMVSVDDELLPRGRELFSLNCAPCHGASGRGGAVGGGAVAWPVAGDEPRVVAEAMLTGPGPMPVFDLPPDDLNAVVTYVEFLGDAPDPGGFSIGGLGPVPEGFVAWVVGMAALGVVVYVIGRRWDRTGHS